MGLEIRAAMAEDLSRIFKIRASAMEPDIWRKIIFPTGRSSDTTVKAIKAWQDELSRPESPLYVAIDNVSSEIVAFAKWTIYEEARPDQVWNTPYQENSAGPEANDDAWSVMDRYNHNMHLQFIRGDPHICLDYLCTDPVSQGTGAGRILIQWGLEIADRKRLPCYLSSTDAGRPFYQKRDFKVLDTLKLDASQYGLNETATLDFMRREPSFLTYEARYTGYNVRKSGNSVFEKSDIGP